MNKLEKAFLNLDARLSSVEKNIAKLNNLLSIENQSSPANASMASHPTHSPVANLSNIPPEASAKSIVSSADSKSPDSFWILGVTGIIFVILAGVFFIKISIDSGWLTPMRQILLASGAGLAFFIVPNFFPKAEKEYGALLAGSGTAILHLSWLGGYIYHKILTAPVALVCASLVGIFSIASKLEKGNRIYVLVAMAGTYLSAPVVGYNHEDLNVLSIFFIIWNISFSLMALIVRRRDLLFLAGYFAAFSALLLSGNANTFAWRTDLLILQLVQFVIFSASLTGYSLFYKETLSKDESIAIFPLLLLFYFSSDDLILRLNYQFAPWYGAVIGTVILGIYLIAKKVLADHLDSGPSLTAFATIGFIHSFYFQLLDESLKPMAGLLIGISVLWCRKRMGSFYLIYQWPLLILLSTFVYGSILTVSGVKPIELLLIYHGAYGLFAFLVAIFGASLSARSTKNIQLLLGFAHFEVMLGLYRLSQEIAWSGALFVTVSWAIYAGSILVVAYSRRDKNVGYSALMILMAVSLKALLYDLVNTSSLIRVACLLVEGILLYGCGLAFRKMQAWDGKSLSQNP